ncbi:MAG TPA: hypothetical protein VIT92_00505 [Burkholderiaceae bacterium]
MSAAVEIHGAFLQGLVTASHSLNLLLRDTTPSYEPDRWYPVAALTDIIAALRRYRQLDPILRQLGIEMVRRWQATHPVGAAVRSGIEYLRLQQDSAGIQTVLRGPVDQIGRFDLAALDVAGGTAAIRSSTVFPRALEYGTLLTGLAIGGDLLYFQIDHAADTDTFEIRFVTDANRASLSWQQGPAIGAAEWRLRHNYRMHAMQDEFWRALHDTLHNS